MSNDIKADIRNMSRVSLERFAIQLAEQNVEMKGALEDVTELLEMIPNEITLPVEYEDHLAQFNNWREWIDKRANVKEFCQPSAN